MAAPYLEAARYRACASRRACARSARRLRRVGGFATFSYWRSHPYIWFLIPLFHYLHLRQERRALNHSDDKRGETVIILRCIPNNRAYRRHVIVLNCTPECIG